MSATWLLVDVSNLMYRAFFTTGGLQHEGQATGALFGFLRAVTKLSHTFMTSNIAFCFDVGRPLRQEVYPAYKANRHKAPMSASEKEARRMLKRQIYELRTVHLTDIGYTNIFGAEGFEADDCIASAIQHRPRNTQFVMVSSDKDLFQLLVHAWVSQYIPSQQRCMTKTSFTKAYGIDPDKWAQIKAIEGCKTDNIEGIHGVGTALATRYLRHELKNTSKAAQAIMNGRNIWKRNLALTTLPYAGCPEFVVTPQCISYGRWADKCLELGMQTLASSPPFGTRNDI